MRCGNVKLSLCHESCRASHPCFLKLDLLVDVGHSDGHWLIKVLNDLVFLLELALDAPDRQLEQLVLPFGLNDLVLEEIFVLLESLSTGHPVLDLLVQLLLFSLHFDSLLVQGIHLLVQVVDRLVLERVVRVLGVQLLN